MPPFEIWPSEALLLGYAVGSYSGGSPFQKFLSHLKETVSHFIADFGLFSHAGHTPIMRDGNRTALGDLLKGERPDELFVFVDVDAVYRVGASLEIPDLLVERPRSYNSVRDELWEQHHVGPDSVSTRLEEGRRSLTDLVIIHFGEFLDLSPGQHLLRHLAMMGQPPEGWRGVVRRFFTQPNAAAAWRSVLAAGEEQMDKCSEKLQQFADENGCGEAYLAGRLFGEACRQTTTEELRYWLWDDEAASELKCEITEPPHNGADVFYSGPNAQLDRLLQLGVVNSSLLCSSVLSSIRSRSLELTIEEACDWLASELLDILIVRDTRRMLQVLSWCFGSLHGELWRGEAPRRDKALEKAAPRSLAEVCLAHPDDIRRQLKHIWRMLDLPNFEPEDVIRGASNAVEVLITKRIRPDTQSVSEAIREMLQSGTELEKRLAAIAQPLHYEYRNRVAHVGRADYSFNEAAYFLAGVRAMVDLVERVEEERRSNM